MLNNLKNFICKRLDKLTKKNDNLFVDKGGLIMSKKGEFEMVWETMWTEDEDSATDPKILEKARAFRKLLLIGFQKSLRPERSLQEILTPTVVDQKTAEAIQKKAWERFQIKKVELSKSSDLSTNKTVNLFQWLKGKFPQDWLTLDKAFGRTIPAFMGNSKVDTVVEQRAKRIDLVKQTIVLIVNLKKQDERKVKITLQVFPFQENVELAKDLKLKVIPQIGESVITHKKNNRKQVWLFQVGEQFNVELTLNEVIVVEHFSI